MRHSITVFPVVSILTACLLAVGCGAPRSGPVTQTTIDRLAVDNTDFEMTSDAGASSDMVSAPVDRVWSILPLVYDDLGVELSFIDSEIRWLGNTRFRQREIDGERLSRFLDCGSGTGFASYADTYLVTMVLTTGVSASADGGSVVRTRFQAVAEPSTTSGNELRCTSKRTLERRILEIIAERLEVDSSHAG